MNSLKEPLNQTLIGKIHNIWFGDIEKQISFKVNVKLLDKLWEPIFNQVTSQVSNHLRVQLIIELGTNINKTKINS